MPPTARHDRRSRGEAIDRSHGLILSRIATRRARGCVRMADRDRPPGCLRQVDRAVVQPRGDDRVGITLVGSCQSCLRGIDLAVSDDRRAQGFGWRGAGGTSRFRRGRRRCRRSPPAGCPAWWCRTKTARCCGRQPQERAIEGVPVVDRDRRVGAARSVDRQRPDPRCSIAGGAALLVTGIHEQPMEPGREAFRIAQPRELAPGEEECLLDGVLGSFDIAKDPVRDRVAHGRRPGRPARVKATSSPSRARSTSLVRMCGSPAAPGPGASPTTDGRTRPKVQRLRGARRNRTTEPCERGRPRHSRPPGRDARCGDDTCRLRSVRALFPATC